MHSLFSNLFPDADRTAWLTQVQQELKSGDAAQSLRWKTDEGFTLEPYYTADSLNDLPLDAIQAAQKLTAGWLNAPDYRITDEKEDNALLINALNRGADALILHLTASSVNVSKLLNGIKLSDIPVFFRLTSGQADFIRLLKTVAPYQLKGGLLADDSDVTAEATRLTADSPQFRTVYVSSHAFHNAGATITQELAFTLASLVDTYDKLTESGLTIEQLVPKTILSVSVGTSYFPEIAKLRALRVLLSRLLAAYTSSFITGSPGRSSFVIHTQTSTFYDAAVTPYTNLIRATTEAMSAVIGGCDLLTVHPYNTVLSQSADTTDRDFANRIARNVSLLLKEESYLNKVADPSAGSYYVENLTHQLVETAWSLFLDIEKRGGLAKSVTDGFIKQETERAYQAKVDAVRTGKVLVGVTKFRSDDPLNQPDTTSRNTMSWLPNRRLAEEFE